MKQGVSAISIDELMEQASEALVSMDYFRAEKASLKAMDVARARGDFETMARVVLPLQEARRQKRQLAMDAGVRLLLSAVPRRWSELRAGMYLVQPPLLGIDARAVREVGDQRRIPMFVLCREPMTRTGNWPVVAVSGVRESTPSPTNMISVRAQVAPPAGAARVEATPTKDSGEIVPDTAWFLAAGEALGDAAIARLDPKDHPHHRVDELLEYLDAFPDHEKLHQALESTCRAAMGVEPPTEKRVFKPARPPTV